MKKKKRLKIKQSYRETEANGAEREAEVLEIELNKIEKYTRPASLCDHESGDDINPNDNLASSSKLSEAKLVSVMEKQNEISLLLANNFERTLLPKKELKVFHGSDNTIYRQFIQTFERNVATICLTDADKLSYLNSVYFWIPTKTSSQL